MDLTKRVPYRNKKITQAARGEICTICGEPPGEESTTVFCHLNESWAGKGLSQKADDCAGFFGCNECHDVYDGRAKRGWLIGPEEVLKGYYRTIRRLLDKGIIS